MFKLLCVYFLLHIQLTKSDSLHQTRNCSNELEPLLNLVSNQGKKVVLIPEKDQISLEHETPHFDVEPCDLHQYRKNLVEQNHHHERVSAKHLKVTPFYIDQACGCNFVKNQEWRPDNWSTLMEQKQQQSIQGYELIYLYWPCQAYHISHIEPSRQNIQVMEPYYFIDIFMLFPYILTSFFEKYQWISWKVFFDDRSYPKQETDPCCILLKDMPTIRSIEVNHNIGSDVNASNIEECNFRKKTQIITISDSEVKIRIPAAQVYDIRPDIQNENHYHDRLYFQWYWSTSGRPHNWIVIHLRHGPLRKRETTVWWILDIQKTIITYNKHYFMPPSLRPKNSIFSYWRSHTYCENNQWTLRASNGRNLKSTVTLEPRTSTQCWPYHTSPAQCSDYENHTYCTPTLGRLEKVLLQSSTNVTNWEDRLQYEPFCKAFFQELEPRHDIFQYYKKLVQTGQFSELFNITWFSLHSMHSTNGNAVYVPRQFNSSNLENQIQQILLQFDQQNNFTMEMVKNYDQYQIQKRHFDSLLLRLMDQLELITDENGRTRLFQTMTTVSNKASAAERSQLWIRTIIKRHDQTLRSNLECHYVLKTNQQSLLTLDTITDLHQDIIYQYQFRNGKIISSPKFRIVDSTTTTDELTTTQTSTTTTKDQTMTTNSAETTEVVTTTISPTIYPEIDWEKVNEIDEQESERNTGIFTPILSSIVNTLMAIGSTIVYGVYLVCTSSNSTIHSNVVPISP